MPSLLIERGTRMTGLKVEPRSSATFFPSRRNTTPLAVVPTEYVIFGWKAGYPASPPFEGKVICTSGFTRRPGVFEMSHFSEGGRGRGRAPAPVPVEVDLAQ